MNKKLFDGAACKVIVGTHAGTFGVVQNIQISSDGKVVLTVQDEAGEHLETLAEHVEIL